MVAAAPVSSSSPSKRKGRGNSPQIPLLTRIKAKNLYVGQAAPASEVARLTGLSIQQVYALASREKWASSRAIVKAKAEETVLARAQRNIDELVEEVANDTAELALGSLKASKQVLALVGEDRNAPRDLQALSQASKNFVGLYRQAKQLDAQAEQASSTSVNVLFLSALPEANVPRGTQERNVTPDTQPQAIEVQVQHVSAQPPPTPTQP